MNNNNNNDQEDRHRTVTCKHWNNNKDHFCPHGYHCKYFHPDGVYKGNEDNSYKPKREIPCKWDQQNPGSCPFGVNCDYKHQNNQYTYGDGMVCFYHSTTFRGTGCGHGANCKFLHIRHGIIKQQKRETRQQYNNNYDDQDNAHPPPVSQARINEINNCLQPPPVPTRTKKFINNNYIERESHKCELEEQSLSSTMNNNNYIQRECDLSASSITCSNNSNDISIGQQSPTPHIVSSNNNIIGEQINNNDNDTQAHQPPPIFASDINYYYQMYEDCPYSDESDENNDQLQISEKYPQTTILFLGPPSKIIHYKHEEQIFAGTEDESDGDNKDDQDSDDDTFQNNNNYKYIEDEKKDINYYFSNENDKMDSCSVITKKMLQTNKYVNFASCLQTKHVYCGLRTAENNVFNDKRDSLCRYCLSEIWTEQHKMECLFVPGWVKNGNEKIPQNLRNLEFRNITDVEWNERLKDDYNDS